MDLTIAVFVISAFFVVVVVVESLQKKRTKQYNKSFGILSPKYC